MKPRVFQTLAFACCLLALAACSRGTTGRAEKPAPSAPGVEKDTASAPAAGAVRESASARSASALELPQSRMVIKTASLSVRVRDVDAAFARAVQLAEQSGGYVQSSTQSIEGGDRADLTLRVPPDRFLSLISTLESLGTEESKSIEGEDVTQEYYDLDAELQSKTEVRARLFQLLERATKVSDAIQVEEQLERVGADVNRIKGRMKYLQTMVGLSTVNVSLYSEARPSAEEFLNWSLVGHGFVVAARVLVQALFFILQALVVLIPLGVIGGAAAWGIVVVVRRRRAMAGRNGTRGRK
jgi:hypothetical protein